MHSNEFPRHQLSTSKCERIPKNIDCYSFRDRIEHYIGPVAHKASMKWGATSQCDGLQRIVFYQNR